MKVLFISSNRPQFDIVPFIKSQADSLIDNGIDVEHYLLESRGGMKAYLRHIPKLRKHIKENNYDLIHAHYSYTGWTAVLAMTGKPIVVSFMGTDVYGQIGEEGRRGIKARLITAMSWLLQPFVKQIIVKSKNLYEYVSFKGKTHIVPNGVNFERFKPRDKKEVREQLGLPADKKIVLSLALQDLPRKNFALLVEAAEKVQQSDWEVVNPYPVAPEKAPLYMSAADVFGLTSYQEGSPNVIKEAMATNCPIVSTDVGDVKEVIANTDGCYLCTHDVTDVSEKLVEAMDFSGQTTGRKDIEHLEINTVAKKIISIYEKCLKK